MLKILRSIFTAAFRSGSAHSVAPVRRKSLMGRTFRTAIAATMAILVTGLLMPPGFAQQEAIAASPSARGGAEAPQYVPDEVLVKFEDDATDAEMADVHASHRSGLVKAFRHVRNLHHVKLAPGDSVKQAIERYHQHPRVLYAEPNWIVHAVENVPNDPRFNELWGLKNIGQTVGGIVGTTGADIDAGSAWDSSTGNRSVVVAVIDTGVDYTHPDLAANVYQGDCSNGFVGDCHGWNVAVSGDIKPNGNPMDDFGHGTHVSGTIGAVGNNGVGVAGVNWQVTILACKFLDSSGSGTTAGAIACLDYVAAQKNKGVNVIATNNSWGGVGYSQALEDAIAAQRALGILFIAAAGNSSSDNDTAPFYPAGHYLPNVISVAATTATDDLAVFSNWGLRTVHMGAPGDQILSTMPNNSYGLLSGTSMATPHVTGVVALLKARYPAATWVEIKNRILAGGENIPSMAGTTATEKRLNANGALNCSNSVVLSRLRPVGDFIVSGVGQAVTLDALHINCGSPNGPVTVTVNRDSSPAGPLPAVTLNDTGATGV